LGAPLLHRLARDVGARRGVAGTPRGSDERLNAPIRCGPDELEHRAGVRVDPPPEASAEAALRCTFDAIRPRMHPCTPTELAPGGLHRARLLVRKPATDGEPVRIFSNDVLDAAIPAFFQELLRADPDAAHQPQDVAIRRRLEARLGGGDALVAEAFHRGEG